MRVDIVQVIKYFCILLMMIYTISSLEILPVRSKKRQRLRFHFHNLIIFAFHFLANLSLMVQQEAPMPYLWFYISQVAFFALFLLAHCYLYKDSNRMLLNHMILLLSVGFVILMRLDPERAQKQFLYTCMGAAVSLAIPYIVTKLRLTKLLAIIFGIAGLLLLCAVFVRGKMVYGANLSLNFFGIVLQPSEFVKLSFILLIAMMFRKNHSLRRVMVTTLVAMAHVGVLMLSKDLGGALIFFVTYLFMLYAATHTAGYSLFGLFMASVLGVAIFFIYKFAQNTQVDSKLSSMVVRIFSHVETRINNWLDPWSKIGTDGYQITQSLFAILSGGWFGTGLNKGFPKQIPVVEKDFTFAAIFEEFGGLFCMCLVLVCLCLLLSILIIAVRMNNNFYKLMAVGFASVYGVQVFLVVGGVTKLIPHTGVTLPLISYGGSSICSTLFLFALVQGLTVLWRKSERERKQQEFYQKRLMEMQGLAQNTASSVPEAADDFLVTGMEEISPSDLHSKKRKKRIQRQKEEELETQELQRNTEVFGVAYLHCAMFFCVCIYFIVLLSGDSYELQNNSYNSVRIQAMNAQVRRGEILAENGDVLASNMVIGDEECRVYPYGNMFAHVVGYLENGKSGVEALANYWLTQTTDDWKSRFLSEIFGKKRQGYSVYSTLNYKAQKEAYEQMGEHWGAIVALDANTGDVLVMVSKPDFDPNLLQQAETSTASKQTNLFNRAVSGLYPPGSSFKPVTMLAYMRAYPNRWRGEVYECNGQYPLNDHIIHCSNEKEHGFVDFSEALAESCNGFFANLALQLTPEQFNQTTASLLFQKKLSVGASHGVTEVPALTTAYSSATMSDSMSETSRAIMGIGQGSVQISPMHSALISAAIANGGRMPSPRYFEKVVNESGELVKTMPYASLGQVMSAEEAGILKEAMIGVVETGTGYMAASDGYVSGGKTGSAQFMTGSLDTHAIYTGFGEKDGRCIAIAVFVENGGSGGQVAAPMAKAVLDALFMEN